MRVNLWVRRSAHRRVRSWSRTNA